MSDAPYKNKMHAETYNFLCPLCHDSFAVDAAENRLERRCRHCGGRVRILLDLPDQTATTDIPNSHGDVAAESSLGAEPAAAPDEMPVWRIQVPADFYVVAALFLAGGVTDFVYSVARFVDAKIIDVAGFATALIKIGCSQGLLRFSPSWRGWAQIVLGLDIALRALTAVVIAVFLYEQIVDWFLPGGVQDKSGSMKWYRTVNGQRQSLTTSDGLQVMIWALLSGGIRIWQLRTLQRPDVRELFQLSNRDRLVGQMSLVRFMMLTTVLVTLFLAAGRLLSDMLRF
jgi:hypothetical protein